MQDISLQFFLLPKQVVNFQRLEKTPSIIHPSQVKQDLSTQGKINALKYRYELKYLGKEYEKVFVLCIPAHQHMIVSKQAEIDNDVLPLVKTFKQTNLKGYLSGRRSAIFIKGNKLIRYKGCGNDVQGFVNQNNNLRGSHFYHTAKRQMFMTNLINHHLLAQINETSANIPIAFYQFPDIQDLQLKNELKLLSKHCCVFQTKGDRRLGTHLISPLQIIFLNIMELNSTKLNDFFNTKNRQDKTGLTELLIDFQFSLQGKEIFLQKYKKSLQFSNYVTIDDFQDFYQEKLKQKTDINKIINKIANGFAKEYQMQEEFAEETNWIEIFNIILKKIGWQIGQIKRIFCQKDINWGFFNDHGYWHCNAHLNNFIIKPPRANQRLTLPLDYDLAFTNEEYINIDIDSSYYGQKDQQSFQNLLLSEYNAMQMSISGLEIMNFKYGIQGQAQQAPSNEIKMARVIFRDSIIKAFRCSMKNNKEYYAKWNYQWNENIKEINQLIKICLRMSSDFQT